MENQHRKILGYRELSQEEIDLMNEIKAKGHELAVLLEKAKKHITQNAVGPEAVERHALAEPHRWLARAKTAGQDAVMFAVRSIAQPDDGF